MIWPSIALVAFVTLQRLVELPIAHANMKRLLAAGGYEVGAGHYPLLVAVHVAARIAVLDRVIRVPERLEGHAVVAWRAGFHGTLPAHRVAAQEEGAARQQGHDRDGQRDDRQGGATAPGDGRRQRV